MTILSFSFLINTIAIIAGGCAGSLLRGRLRTELQSVTVRTTGAVVMAVGIFGVLYGFFPFANSGTEAVGWLLVILALPIGWTMGSSLQMEKKLDKVSDLIVDFTKDPTKAQSKGSAKAAHGESAPSKKLSFLEGTLKLPIYPAPMNRSQNRFADGFAIASVYLITTTVTLHGIIQAGGDASLLYWKSLVDFVIISALATVYGSGVIGSVISFILTVAVITICDGLWNTVGTALTERYTAAVDAFSGNSSKKSLIKALPQDCETLFSESIGKISSQNSAIAAVITVISGLLLGTDRKNKAETFIPALFISPLYYSINVLAFIIEGIVLFSRAGV